MTMEQFLIAKRAHTHLMNHRRSDLNQQISPR